MGREAGVARRWGARQEEQRGGVDRCSIQDTCGCRQMARSIKAKKEPVRAGKTRAHRSVSGGFRLFLRAPGDAMAVPLASR